MCYKCWLEHDGAHTISTGVLAVKGKHYDKIVTKIRWLRQHVQQAVGFGTKGYSRTELL